MTPYVGSTYRPDMSSAMARLNLAAPVVRPEQISELDNKGNLIPKPEPEPVATDSGNYGG
jgi:hypothetical protein